MQNRIHLVRVIPKKQEVFSRKFEGKMKSLPSDTIKNSHLIKHYISNFSPAEREKTQDPQNHQIKGERKTRKRKQSVAKVGQKDFLCQDFIVSAHNQTQTIKQDVQPIQSMKPIIDGNK